MSIKTKAITRTASKVIINVPIAKQALTPPDYDRLMLFVSKLEEHDRAVREENARG